MNLVKTSNNMKGMAGEYFVCAELCKQNILALLTPKNNPLFDIVATNPAGGKAVSIQVKAMGIENKQGWKLGKDILVRKNNGRLYVVLVNLKENEPNDYYVFKYDTLSDRINEVYMNYMKQAKRDGSKRKDVGFRWMDLRNFTQKEKKQKNSWRLILQALQ
jgi:hypothetical protein